MCTTDGLSVQTVLKNIYLFIYLVVYITQYIYACFENMSNILRIHSRLQSPGYEAFKGLKSWVGNNERSLCSLLWAVPVPVRGTVGGRQI